MSGGDASSVAVAKSILIGAGMEFGVSGEEVQDLFGYGRFPTGYNVAMGAIRIWVRPEDEAVARQLLHGLSAGDAAGVDLAGDDWEAEPRPETWARRVAKVVVTALLVFSALEVLAILVSWIMDMSNAG